MSESEETEPRTGGQRSLRDLLSGERVVIPLPAESLDRALEALGRGLVADDAAGARATVLEELSELDPATLVPLGERAVLAHLRSEATEEVRVAVGVADRPLGFVPETAPGARVLIVVVSPAASTRAYLQTLGALGRVLRRKDVAARLLEARSSREVLAIPALREPVLGPDLLVRDVMTVDVVSVTPETSLSEVASLMVRRRLRALPVVNERREVMGLITDRHVMEHFLPRLGETEESDGEGEERVTARDAMLRSVLCVKEEESLRDVAALMISKDTERFPVCAEGALVGFLTRGDIIRRLLGARLGRAGWGRTGGRSPGAGRGGSGDDERGGSEGERR